MTPYDTLAALRKLRPQIAAAEWQTADYHCCPICGAVETHAEVCWLKQLLELLS